MIPIIINRVMPLDILPLFQLGKKTFIESFAEHNSEENMQKYVEASFTIDKIQNELTNPTSEFYFAIKNQIKIGYLKINRVSVVLGGTNHKSIQIERIYVLKDHQGIKAGQKLLEKALDEAKTSEVDYVWLGVWEKNIRAIQFYTKNGFEESDRVNFMLGDDKQTDIIMKSTTF
ncbi:MAG: GNAT family N-acetyltransferase [Saprospiraceae bacterium]|nr:GNAT family N-acetyltransferase [Saprospiraceae bacterium]